MKTGFVIIAGIGLALLALLYFSPVTPPQASEPVTEREELPEDAPHNPDEEVEEALRQLQDGEVPPMQAILKIREIAEKHPRNVKASFTLGVLSIRSGQFEKAIERFNAVLDQEPENGEVWRLLAEAQLRSGDTATARESFNKALLLVDEETGTKFQKELPELSTN